jgi:prepilin-type N-terminal cleavage/methylation domain-containing protein
MKRRGFTLIELMVVIAIIIILAAIAIPNYLSMTARAKRSRVASDMNAIATALESYKTDWGFYPKISTAERVSDTQGDIYKELTGQGGSVNVSTNFTSSGEAGGVGYMKAGTLQSIKNPLDTGTVDNQNEKGNAIFYISDANGSAWKLVAHDASGNGSWYYTADSQTTLTNTSTQPTMSN